MEEYSSVGTSWTEVQLISNRSPVQVVILEHFTRPQTTDEVGTAILTWTFSRWD